MGPIEQQIWLLHFERLLKDSGVVFDLPNGAGKVGVPKRELDDFDAISKVIAEANAIPPFSA